VTRWLVTVLAAALVLTWAVGASGHHRPGHAGGTATPPPTTTPPPGAPPSALYGIFASSSADRSQVANLGFNAVTVDARVPELDAAWAQGLAGVVWLGGYQNEPACQFVESDDWVRSHVLAIKDHPGVRGYQIDNEPHATECPGAPAQVRARAALVRSLDPSPAHPTMLAVYREYEFDDYAGATDVLRVGMYPCSHLYGCNLSRITQKVASARAAGWTRVWGSPQAFGDEYYRTPSPAELQAILDTWRAAGVTDLLSYVWDRTDPDTLSARPELWPVFKANAPRT
jgi:hypothetical protein